MAIAMIPHDLETKTVVAISQHIDIATICVYHDIASLV